MEMDAGHVLRGFETFHMAEVNEGGRKFSTREIPPVTRGDFQQKYRKIADNGRVPLKLVEKKKKKGGKWWKGRAGVPYLGSDRQSLSSQPANAPFANLLSRF